MMSHIKGDEERMKVKKTTQKLNNTHEWSYIVRIECIIEMFYDKQL